MLLKFVPLIMAVLVLCPLQPAPADTGREIEYKSISCGGKELLVEVSKDEKSRNRGLMHRESLDDGKGMLFIYPRLRIGRLWMRNTLIPLSAAFINEEGVITGIVRMERTESTKIYRSKVKIKYALEVPLGWFEANGVAPGDRCVLPDITPE
jgi:uncharacterized membrane protein (UPF0127 family)